MILVLEREIFTDISTIGKLYIDGLFECYVLEDKDRGLKQSMGVDVINQLKVYGKTAIPSGTYKLIVNMSNRFKKLMPLLIDVKGYEGVRIHSGNTAENSLGCLIVGTSIAKDRVNQSIPAFNRLMAKLKGQKDITIEIKNKANEAIS